MTSVMDLARSPSLENNAASGLPADMSLRPVARVANGTLFALTPALNTGSTATPDLSGFASVLMAFDQLGVPSNVRLFLPYDARLARSPELSLATIHELAQSLGINGDNVIITVKVGDQAALLDDLSRLREDADRLGFRTALADFGAGAANADILPHLSPRYAFLEPGLIGRAHFSATNRKLLRAMIDVALTIDSSIIVTGVDTPTALYTVRDLATEFAEGTLIGAPATNGSVAVDQDAVDILTRRNMRKSEVDDAHMIRNQIVKIDAIPSNAPVEGLFEIFRRHKDKAVVPVVDEEGYPLGIVREPTIKDYIYSKYGRDLLSNASYQKTILSFMSPCPIVPLHSTAEKVLDAYSRMEASDGVLVTKNGHYFGFLSAAALLHIINDKNIQSARDQNPLTRLPGNKAIEGFIDEACEALGRHTTLAYLDIDDFKPFNDIYGFRQGDRVLFLLSEILKKKVPPGNFIGHIGGDDFFIGLRDLHEDQALAIVSQVQCAFKEEVESFYSDSDRNKGHLVAQDRFGTERKFSLMTLSAAVLHLTEQRDETTVEDLFQIVGSLKKQAKAAEDGQAVHTA